MKKNISNSLLNGDIEDSEKDKRKMQSEETILDLPDVKDIPGQEHIQPPKMREFVDTTISSDDEEGKGLLDFEEKDITDESQVSKEEEQLLEKAAASQANEDDKEWEDAKLDNTDDEGDFLNEGDDLLGDDLDVPGSEDDDANEQIGEEDEENNSYSIGGDKK
ncbi:MAG: hypothetical protein ABI675_11270 [Chitinophagaceae bacterium]